MWKPSGFPWACFLCRAAQEQKEYALNMKWGACFLWLCISLCWEAQQSHLYLCGCIRSCLTEVFPWNCFVSAYSSSVSLKTSSCFIIIIKLLSINSKALDQSCPQVSRCRNHLCKKTLVYCKVQNHLDCSCCCLHHHLMTFIVIIFKLLSLNSPVLIGAGCVL